MSYYFVGTAKSRQQMVQCVFHLANILFNIFIILQLFVFIKIDIKIIFGDSIVFIYFIF